MIWLRSSPWVETTAERWSLAAPPPINRERVLADTATNIGPISLDAQRRRLHARVRRQPSMS